MQAPIGSLTTPELAAAVSGAGGLGTLALTWVDVEDAILRVRRVRELTDRPFAVNFVLCFDVGDVLDACLAEGVRIVSTFWGDPAAVGRRIHAAGALHLHTVESVVAAEQAVEAGVDVIVAQGWEAGGHVKGSVTTMALVPPVVDAVAPVPVIAAGGIADGRGLAAALVLGAQAGWLGTRFVASVEAAAHPCYREAVTKAVAEHAHYSSCFDGGWPDAPHRTVRNSTLRDWQDACRPASPGRPGEGDTVAQNADGVNIPRYSSAAPLESMTGAVEAMALYAGQSVGLIRDIGHAADIVSNVAREARDVLTRAGGR